jgi:class 3 adenylate cyclase/pimeloyl-ACP methyl ester carboxylesterase
MLLPETHYAKSGNLSIAYQVLGSGPFDLVFVPGYISNLDVNWEMPLAHLYRRLASFCRLIIFDKRGTGLSDRNCGIPTLEERIDDVRAVMDAVGSSRASIFGMSEGGAMALMFAATYPDMVRSLVLYAPGCRFPGAPPRPQMNLEWVDKFWGTGVTAATFAPSQIDNQQFREVSARVERAGASPSGVKALYQMNSLLDVGAILPAVRVPCLLVHRTGDRATNVEVSRQLSKKLQNARFVELPGEDHAFVGDTRQIFDEFEEFLTGSRPVETNDRVLATVLFTDIVNSTERAQKLGDRAWHQLLDQHDEVVKMHVGRNKGRVIKSLGDGCLATFDGPARAVRCSSDIIGDVATLGLSIRAGLHVGEIEVGPTDITGIAVHMAARVMAAARPSQTLVSGTVKDLVAGSNIRFQDEGLVALKGIDSKVQLFSVV